MDGFIIRKVRFDELPDCAAVIRGSFLTVAAEFGLTEANCPTNGAFIKTERLVRDWSRGDAMYGLFSGSEQAGFMALRERDRGAYELEKLSVLPQYRHRGGGALLLGRALEEVSGSGGNRITIGIIESNGRLKEWYLKHGFVHTGTASFPHLPFAVGFMEREVPAG